MEPACPPDLYKAYLEDLGRIGGRHETARQFYLSVVSALFVFLSMAGYEGILASVRGAVLVVAGVVGIVVCVAWFEHMRSFAALFDAKLHTLRALEEGLTLKPFSIETEALSKNGYTPLTTVDKIVPVAMAILFAVLIFFKSRG